FVARPRQMQDGDYHIQLTERWPGGSRRRHAGPVRHGAHTRNPRPQARVHVGATVVAVRGRDADPCVRLAHLGYTPHHTRITFWEVPVTRIEVWYWRDLSSP